MPVKHPILLSVLMLGASTVVHSQSMGPGSESAGRPADLFGRAASSVAEPARTSPKDDAGRADDLASDPRTRIGRAAAATPWGFMASKPRGAGPADDTADKATAIDLGPLRYYAAQNDLKRVAAEIRLLRSKNAGWEPPEDLFSAGQGSAEEQPLWALFASHQYGAVRAGIDDLRQRTPGWQPSADLLAKLGAAEAYERLVRASDAQQWRSVVEIASASRPMLTCGNVDAIWRTAEALERTGDEAHAAEGYRYILASCSRPEDRLATVQKANLVLKSPVLLDGLLEMGRHTEGDEFASVRLDLIRTRIGDAAAGKAGAPVAPADVETLASVARTDGNPDDAQLLGWNAYAHKDMAGAEQWFTTALQAAPGAKAAEGLVLSLRDGGKRDQARTAALRYADLDHGNRKLMIELLSADLNDPKAATLSPGDVAALGKAVETERSVDGAQALGWALFKRGDLPAADAWFHTSAGWEPNESAAIGLVVTARRLKHAGDYAAAVATYKGVYPRVAELDALMKSPVEGRKARGGPVRSAHAHGARTRVARGAVDGGWDRNAAAIVDTFQGGHYDQAMVMLDERKARRHQEPKGLSVVRGWAMYHKGDWEGASRVFADLKNGGMAPQGQEGLRVIQQGYTNPRYR